MEIIKDNLGEQNKAMFTTWFVPIVPVKLEDNELTIEVPTQFYYEWIEEHFIDLVRKTIRHELGPNGKLKYSIPVVNAIGGSPVHTTLPSSGRQATQNPAQDIPFNVNREGMKGIPNPFVIPGIQKVKIHSQLNDEYTMENFVEGDCNRLARAAGLAVAERPGQTAFNPVLLHGGVGLGKTHLANAIGLKTKELHPEKTVLYVTSEQFMQQYADAGKNKTISDFLQFYEMVDMLIVDDIQFWANKAPGTQEAFFHIFNDLHQKGKQIIITSDKAPAELSGLQTRLVSRLKWGLAADLLTPSVETRMGILRQKLAKDGIEMSDDVIEYIAYNINTNVRELEGALISIIAESSFNKKEITIGLAKQMVDKLVKYTTREITIDLIQKTVCDYYGIAVDSIQSKTRKREIVQARQLTMYFAKKHTKSSLAIIGLQCGNKDHATVLHACKTVANLVQSDKHFNHVVTEIEKRFSE